MIPLPSVRVGIFADVGTNKFSRRCEHRYPWLPAIDPSPSCGYDILETTPKCRAVSCAPNGLEPANAAFPQRSKELSIFMIMVVGLHTPYERGTRSDATGHFPWTCNGRGKCKVA